MLGKLMKHELKDTMRLFLPMFGFIAVLTPIFSFMMRIGSNYNDTTENSSALDIVFGSGIAGYLLLLFALMIVTQVLIVIRFYRTMASTEAYLTFTLPAKTGSILLSKWIVSMIWYVISFIIAAASILTVLLIATPLTLGNISDAITFLTRYVDLNDFITMVLFVVMILCSISVTILRMYVSVMIGQLAKTHRIALSIGIYLALSQGLSVVLSLLTIPFFFILDSINSINVLLLLACIGYGILAAGFYVATYFLTAKKLNIK